jgi:DivIVA domain-containing protein
MLQRVLLVPSRIRSMSFGLAARGYDPRQVDDVLHQIAAALESGATVDPTAFVTSFESVDGGYSMEDVDRYVAAVLQELQRRADAAAMVAAQGSGDATFDESPAAAEPQPPPPTPETQLTLEQAAALLVAESAIEAETDRGDTLEIWTISHQDAVVSASAPRLAVSTGLQLRYRAVTDTGPVHIHAVIETADYQSTGRAAITVRVTDISRLAALEQRSPRRSVATPATLRAIICDRIVPDQVLPVTLVDLSETGCAVATSDRRVRVRDRLWLYARFLEGEISTEIRIARTTTDLNPVTVGCVFLDPGPDAAIVRQVWTRLHGRS